MVKLRELLGFVGVSSALCLGCTWHEIHQEELTIDEVPDTLALDVDSGDASIIGKDISEVRVSARIQGSSNHLGHGVVGGRLTLFNDCNEVPCSVDITVTVPRYVMLDLRTGSGDVRLEHLREAILLRTGSGDILGRDLSGFDVDAETGSGDILFDVSESADHVAMRTGSGDVSLTVPSGSYRLNVSTGSGDQTLAGVDDDANATSAIEVHTGSGDVRIVGR